MVSQCAASLRMEKKRDWVRYESSQASPSATLLKTTFYEKKKTKQKNNASSVNALRGVGSRLIPKRFQLRDCASESLCTGVFKDKICAEHKHKPFVLGIVFAERKASFNFLFIKN